MSNQSFATLNLVMIIDDHDISNFMAQQVVIATKIANRSIIQPAGFSAINYLSKNIDHQEEIPDLIFLDLDMPVVDGFEFLNQFTSLPKSITQKCKIVILSGHDRKLEMEKWFKSGTVIYYIMKPLTPMHLQHFRESEVYQDLIKRNIA